MARHARALWETFKRGSLLTIPPATWNGDGSYTFTIVGRDADVQSAIECVPDDVLVDIESVGGTQIDADSVLDDLSDRQRAAVEAGLELGYYDEPRDATTEDIAAELGCAPSTAAEHLRKAESTVLRGLFDGRR
uniref:helix-turn-helix domain-containing protein n=1 Tax=Salinadaptatus halalkaliphilus TaxID=2419781 RepID=UPI001FE4FE34|nr:helix-turn-helix domain-containing protein [Salinadaptatus halalkaliphilus]